MDAPAPPESPTPLREPSSLIGMLPEEIAAELKSWGEPAYRAKQVTEWAYLKRAASYDEMTNLSLPLRTRLAAWKPLHTMTIAEVQGSRDTTQKFLFRLHPRQRH